MLLFVCATVTFVTFVAGLIGHLLFSVIKLKLSFLELSSGLMGRKKSSPRWHEVQEAQLFNWNMEEAEALAAIPTANAIEVPAQDATPNEPAQRNRKARKRS